MDILISVLMWAIFGAIPTLIICIIGYFIFKAYKIDSYLAYAAYSTVVGFLCYFFVGAVPYLISGLQFASMDQVVMIKSGEPTIEWYISKAKHSATGAVMAFIIGSAWWWFLVRRKNA